MIERPKHTLCRTRDHLHAGALVGYGQLILPNPSAYEHFDLAMEDMHLPYF